MRNLLQGCQEQNRQRRFVQRWEERYCYAANIYGNGAQNILRRKCCQQIMMDSQNCDCPSLMSQFSHLVQPQNGVSASLAEAFHLAIFFTRTDKVPDPPRYLGAQCPGELGARILASGTGVRSISHWRDQFTSTARSWWAEVITFSRQVGIKWPVKSQCSLQWPRVSTSLKTSP